MVFGPTRASDAQGRAYVLASEPQRRLLAILCLHAGRVVRSTSLEEQLGLTAGALRTSISRLRRAIDPDLVETGPAGYRLNADVDVVEYERLVAAADLADAATARTVLERARSMWRGNPYDEFAHEPWAEAEVGRLGEVHAAAMEHLVTLLLNDGDDPAAMAVLVPLIEEHPYRDRLRALRMLALSHSGRTTEALREFQAYRAVLRDDIGIEPSAAIVDLDRAIVNNDDLTPFRVGAHRVRSYRSPPQPPTSHRSSDGLPTPISSFVGRVRETAEITALLQDHRIVTLTGAGGSGKSRLALRVAGSLRDAGDGDDGGRGGGPTVWWIDLGLLAPGGDVAEQIATEVGVVPRRDPVADLRRRLHAGRSLLVLDNAEHVIADAARVLTDLLMRCPDVRALVTSREPLGVPGEVAWRVPALGLPPAGTSITLDDLEVHDAIGLFVTRAREARPGLAIDRDRIRHIVSICNELDGMPLALELAAARLRTLPLSEVATSIGEIIRWKSEHGQTPLARHATLRASIEWSFERISANEQHLLVALSAFRSPFDTGTAVAVVASMHLADGTPDDISRLADIGLLQLDDDSGRFRMLNTVRQFCLQRAADLGILAATEAAHAAYFADWCDDVGSGRFGLERRVFIRRMPEVVAAMAWARDHDHRAALRMCRALAPVRSTLGQHADFELTWRWLTGLDPAERDALWAEAVAGSLATATSSSLVADTAAAEAAVLERIGDGPGRARSWLERGRAMVPAYRGQPARIMAYAGDLLERRADLEASVYVGFAAYMLSLMGRFEDCEPLLDALRRVTRRHATTFDVDSVGNGYAAAIVVETLRGDLRSALDRGRRPTPADPAFSITSAAALAHAALLATDAEGMRTAIEWSALGSLPLLEYLTPFTTACAALLDRRSTDAADLAEDFWEQAVRVPVWRVFALPVVVRALIGAARPHLAGRFVELADELTIEMEPAPNLAVSVHLARSQVALARDDVEAAERWARAALHVSQSNRFQLATVEAIELLAAVAERHGQDASTLRDAAAAERRRVGYRFSMTAPAAEPPGIDAIARAGIAEVVAQLTRPERG